MMQATGQLLELRKAQILDAHLEEAERQGAEIFNLGWADGDTFIHSKTDQGKLLSQLQEDGNITHEWSQE